MSRMHAILHTAAALAPSLSTRSTRQPGLGYGSSSGYGSPRSYTATAIPARFRIA